MVRSALALVAILILPAFVAGQEIPATHTVVDGDCLWNLAQTYYQDPFDWRRIWDANRDQIEDPNLILPGQVLVLPDGQSEVTVVVVEEPVSRELEPPPIPVAQQRTIFHRDTSVIRAGVVRGVEATVLAISRDRVYSAPRLIALEALPENDGTLSGMASGSAPGGMVRAYDRVLLNITGAAPRVGDRYQTFKVDRTIRDVGQVVVPTGILTVADASDGRVIAIVDKEFTRVSIGDLIGPLPTFNLVRGQRAQAVTGGTAAMVMGFETQAALQDLNHVAFLDVGSDNGINIGDEFDLYNTSAGSDVIEGTLQVIGVSPQTSAARIIQMDDAVFRQGVVVRFAKQMR